MANDKQVAKTFEDVDKKEYTEIEVSQNMNQTATGEKHITIRGIGDVILRYPTRIDEMDADSERSKAYTRFLMDDTLRTEEELKEIAEKRGLWTKKDEKKIESIQEKMLEQQINLSTSKEGNEKKKQQAKLLEVRRDFIDLVNKKNNIFSHTVESKAISVWWQFLVFRCTFNKEGERLWTDYKKYLDEVTSNNTADLIAEYITFYNGFSDSFFDLWLGEATELDESGETDGV